MRGHICEVKDMKNYIVALTGASGVIYGIRLIQELLRYGNAVNAVISDMGKTVLEDESGMEYKKDNGLFRKSFCSVLGNKERLRYYENDDMKAPIASGSYTVDCMVIIPCTMSTVSSIACGASGNLIERAADVMIKEGRQLIIVPRETPLSAIHLENLLKLCRCGIKILPAMPGFYNKPETIDDMINFVVGKTMDLMGIENSIYRRWKE